MNWTLRELEVFHTAAEVGSFTDAAAELRISQAAVSRTIASLERSTGEQLFRRVPRGCELTPAGHALVPHARRVLAEAARFDQYLHTHRGELRLGYAWAALGKHTAPLQRQWAEGHPDIELRLIRQNSATAGLVEGVCDVAILRRPIDDRRFESVVVGLERRFVAFAADDPEWSRRRQLSMADIATRTVVIDTRAGSTTEDMWRDFERAPTFIESTDVDSWLDTISAGRSVGTTSEATAEHHIRRSVTYRPVKDGPRIAVRLVWWRDARPEGLAELIDTVTRLYASARGSALIE